MPASWLRGGECCVEKKTRRATRQWLATRFVSREHHRRVGFLSAMVGRRPTVARTRKPGSPSPPDWRVGCAGWSTPARYRSLFDDGDSVLARYATLFRAVEINSSFYRPHAAKTYARWAASVPADFRFSVKLPQAISHEHALSRAGALLDRFLDEAGALGDRLGGFLLQLPPSLVLDRRVASTFFRMFRRRSDALVACEARHASWFTPAADDLFASHRIARVVADPPRGGDASVPIPGAGWHYWRWHGSPRVYYSDYPEERLRELAAAVAAVPAGEPAWAILDNTAHGFATPNAARLGELLSTRAKARRNAR